MLVYGFKGLAMKIALLGGLILVSATAASAQNAVPPEVVQLENVLVEGDMRTVYVGNASNHYLLYCNIKADAGCITPDENKNYLLFDSNTRWKMPGAKDFLTLAFIQDWTIKYNQGENVGLVPEDGKGDLGLFIRDPTGGGYEQYIMTSDGPIIYGTGMSDVDRQKAWKHFFLQMVKAVGQQQGQDALGVKLARRCMPGQDFCTTSLDANFVGVGGIREPRKVLLVVTTDIHDKDQQLHRMVCTYPAKGTVICRDWDTGKLISAKHAEQ
jgi:hypothetical protein